MKSELPIQKDNKFSVIFSNCMLDMASDLWLISFNQQDICMVHGQPRLANIRYIDMLFYARSLDALVCMIDTLLHKLNHITLCVNDKRATILRWNLNDKDSLIYCIGISWGFIKILDKRDSHRYLGRQLFKSYRSYWNSSINLDSDHI